jgi:hypothetical protein
MVVSPRSAPPRLGGKLGHMEVRRTDINRINDAQIKPTHVSGFYEFSFVGTETTQEVLLEVDFPCWFVDRPVFAPGMEIPNYPVLPAAAVPTDVLVDGEYPTWSATVAAWKRMHEFRPGGGYWTGAHLAVVATGPVGQEWILHWTMDAKAMNIPGGTELDA